MNFNQLHYFLQVCNYGSFSKTAQHVHVTQQALSKAIAALEEEIGLALFYRSVKGITLTESGQFLYEQSKTIFDRLDYISHQLEQMRNQKTETYKVCMAKGMYHFISLELFNTYQMQQPNVHLSVQEDVNLICERKVLEGSMDAAITFGPFDETKFQVIPLISYEMLAIVNIHNKLAHHDEIGFEDLKGQTLVSVKHKSYEFLVEQCKKAGFTPNILFSTDDSVSLYTYIGRHNCIGFGAEHILRNINPDPAVRLIPIKNNAYRRNVCFITTKENRKVKNLEEIGFFLQGNIQKLS